MPDHIEPFLRNDLGVDEESVIRMAKRGFRDVKKKLDAHFSTHDLWNVAPKANLVKTKAEASGDENGAIRKSLAKKETTETRPKRKSTDRKSVDSASGKVKSPKTENAQITSKAVRPLMPKMTVTEGSQFISRDCRLSMPSFDSHVRQRKWRDALVSALKGLQPGSCIADLVKV